MSVLVSNDQHAQSTINKLSTTLRGAKLRYESWRSTSEEHKTYEQLPLKSTFGHGVRLLELLPGSSSSSLRGRLGVFQCRGGGIYESHPNTQDSRQWKKVSYKALSYAWESKQRPEEIIIDGLYFPITSNLCHALRQIRSMTSSVRLWIDLICISQDNAREKSKQIQLIPEIYFAASEVIVWLGRESSDGRLGRFTLQFMEWGCKADLRHMRYISQRFNRVQLEVVIEYFNDFVCGRKKARTHPALTTSMLQEFLQRPYFTRRWVLQELRVARSFVVMCGPYSLPGHTFEQFFKKFDTLDLTIRAEPVYSMMRCRTWFDESNLMTELDYLHHKDCDDPRDRIAALLGCFHTLRRQLQRHFRVDYAKSVELNYFEFAQSMVGLGYWFDLVALAASRPLSTSLPSWVPDWRLAPHKLKTFINEPSSQPVAVVDRYLAIAFSYVLEINSPQMLLTRWESFNRQPLIGDIVVRGVAVSGKKHEHNRATKDRMDRPFPVNVLDSGTRYLIVDRKEGPYFILRKTQAPGDAFLVIAEIDSEEVSLIQSQQTTTVEPTNEDFQDYLLA